MSSVFLLFFDAGGSVYGVCVYTHTHTHCLCGTRDVSPEVGTRHLDSLKNPDSIFVFV